MGEQDGNNVSAREPRPSLGERSSVSICLAGSILISTGQQPCSLWLPSKQPAQELRWQMEIANQEPNQKSDRKIKIHSHEKRNDNRTTETEIKTLSALHVVCGFVCLLSTCQIIGPRHV